MKISVLVLSALLISVNARTAYICNVQFDGYPDSDPNPTLSLGGDQYSFVDDFNSISFATFYSSSGDVEGRVAVKGNMNVDHYTVGYELRTGGVTALDASRPYSLVVGGSLAYAQGSIHPDGSGFPYVGARETGFASTVSNAGAGITVTQASTSNSLDAAFNNAQNYFVNLSNAFASVPDNADFSRLWTTGGTLRCRSNAAKKISVTMTGSQFSAVNYWEVDNCDAAEQLVINIAADTTDVTFSGSNIVVPNVIAESTLYNIQGARIVNIGNIRVEGSILAPLATYNQPRTGVVVGQVIAADFAEVLQINRLYTCIPPKEEVPSPVCVGGFEGNCTGMDITLDGRTFSFRDFNAISFGGFVSASGDTEGRLAVRNSATLVTYSVGHQIQSGQNGRDLSLPYALVVGGDLNFTSGAVFPLGTGNPYPGNQEFIFVGGSLSAPADLQEVRTGSCSTPGCYDAAFDAAQACYTTFSNQIAAESDNVQKNIYWSGAFLTCNDANAEQYTVSFTPAELAQFTYTSLDNCNFQAYWNINIRGTGDVELTGDSFPAIPAGVVYNIIGSRNVYVHDTALAGALLAPQAVLNQPSGVIYGKVVAADIVMSLQINRESECVEAVPVQIPVVIAVAALTEKRAEASKTVSFVAAGGCENFPAGASINSASGSIEIASTQTVSATLGSRTCRINGDSTVAATFSEGTVVGYITRSSTAANTKPAETMDSSAAVFGVSVAALVAASLIL